MCSDAITEFEGRPLMFFALKGLMVLDVGFVHLFYYCYYYAIIFDFLFNEIV